jgi:hypothetical protein
MKELRKKLMAVECRDNNLHVLVTQRDDFLKRWDGKEEVPFEVLEAGSESTCPPVMGFVPKSLVLDTIDKKIAYNEQELKKAQREAVLEMQRLIEEWT